jgi:hypothetical protein
MKEHLSTLIIALIFFFGLLAVDSVRGDYPGFAIASAAE